VKEKKRFEEITKSLQWASLVTGGKQTKYPKEGMAHKNELKCV